jgi:uncharacterized protein YndB with AHSA1/START domain
MDKDRIEKTALLPAPRSRVRRAIAAAREFGAWFRVELAGPFAVKAVVDHSAEPTTQVEFLLEDAQGGTLLCVVESDFDRLPFGRREEALRMNEGGWAEQVGNLERHLSTG